MENANLSVWVFSEPQTGEPVKRTQSMIGCDVSDHVTHGLQNTTDPHRRDLVNSEPQMANSLHQSHMSVNSKSM